MKSRAEDIVKMIEDMLVYDDYEGIVYELPRDQIVAEIQAFRDGLHLALRYQHEDGREDLLMIPWFPIPDTDVLVDLIDLFLLNGTEKGDSDAR